MNRIESHMPALLTTIREKLLGLLEGEPLVVISTIVAAIQVVILNVPLPDSLAHAGAWIVQIAAVLGIRAAVSSPKTVAELKGS
jgi:hypothetical protein